MNEAKKRKNELKNNGWEEQNKGGRIVYIRTTPAIPIIKKQDKEEKPKDYGWDEEIKEGKLILKKTFK